MNHAVGHGLQSQDGRSAARDRGGDETLAREMPELGVYEDEVDVVPILRADGSDADVTRINVDLWER